MFSFHAYGIQGMYSEFLGDWTRKFPRDQLLILRNEDYKRGQREHMDALFKFLGEWRHRPNGDE
jgi:hypothetical protein